MSRDKMLALADELMNFHDCADGDVDAGNGHFRLVTISDANQQRLNLRLVLRESAEALRLSASLLDGLGQSKSADCGHSNEQSAQGLSRATGGDV